MFLFAFLQKKCYICGRIWSNPFQDILEKKRRYANICSA